jgi:glycosyltransferase involved in cell wall biosynthesis
MKALHLFSNAKWTGPAEPALNLCVALRRNGVEADFACTPETAGGPHKIIMTARDRGIEPVLAFSLPKHLNPLTNWFDARRLRAYLRDHYYDIVHCHLDNDHRIAARALRGSKIPLVRSNYGGEGLSAGMKALLGRTSLILEPSRLALQHDEALGLSPYKAVVVPGAVDVERFDPTREVPDQRAWLQIPRDAFVVGIVARMQTHRRYEDFFDAIKLLAEKHGNVHAIVVGRGTKQEQVAFKPVTERGLGDIVHFPGYVDGEDYVGMLKAFDVLVYLVPGSDGTCRTVREAMAMGKPVVAAKRGMLPELVEDSRTGYVFNNTGHDLFQALDRLATNRSLARRLGTAAREMAQQTFALDVQARTVQNLYMDLLGKR